MQTDIAYENFQLLLTLPENHKLIVDKTTGKFTLDERWILPGRRRWYYGDSRDDLLVPLEQVFDLIKTMKSDEEIINCLNHIKDTFEKLYPDFDKLHKLIQCIMDKFVDPQNVVQATTPENQTTDMPQDVPILDMPQDNNLPDISQNMPVLDMPKDVPVVDIPFWNVPTNQIELAKWLYGTPKITEVQKANSDNHTTDIPQDNNLPIVDMPKDVPILDMPKDVPVLDVPQKTTISGRFYEFVQSMNDALHNTQQTTEKTEEPESEPEQEPEVTQFMINIESIANKTVADFVAVVPTYVAENDWDTCTELLKDARALWDYAYVCPDKDTPNAKVVHVGLNTTFSGTTQKLGNVKYVDLEFKINVLPDNDYDVRYNGDPNRVMMTFSILNGEYKIKKLFY